MKKILIFLLFLGCRMALSQATVPTSTAGSNDTGISNTAFVAHAIATAIASAVTNTDGSISVSCTSSTCTVSLNLAHANTWNAAQTLSSLIVNGTGIPVSTGSTSNSDLGGYVTLASGTATQTLAASYTHIPIVHCTDTNVTPTAVGCHATLSGSTVTLTFNGTGTDVISYSVIGMEP